LDRGFTLIEAVMTAAVVSMLVAGIYDAVLMNLKGGSRPVQDAALAAAARNIVTDLRAATAYDPSALKSLYGTTATRSVALPQPIGSTQTVTVNCTTTIDPVASGAPSTSVTATPTNATVVCTNPTTNRSVTIVSQLWNEAPAPGSSLQGTPQ